VLQSLGFTRARYGLRDFEKITPAEHTDSEVDGVSME
jgi:hypothetical protein